MVSIAKKYFCENGNSAFTREFCAELAKCYPTLHVIEDNGKFFIRGSLPIEYQGQELDRFIVEIDLQPLSQGNLPIVREIGGRIPWIPDRHINQEDGSACICIPEDYFRRHPGTFQLMDFIKNSVHGFFIGQALVEQGDPWPHGEWKHREEGREQWIGEFVESLSPEQKKAYSGVLALKELKGHIMCPCLSGRRVRDCHYIFLQRLRARSSKKNT